MVFKGVVVPASDTGPSAGAPLAPLQLVANRPILCHVLGELRKCGVREAALVIAADTAAEARARVQADGPADLRVLHIPYGEQATLEQALEQAARFVGEQPCIVHVADGLLAQPLAPLAELLRDGEPDLLAPVGEHVGEGDSIELATHRLLRLAEPTPTERSVEPLGVRLFGPGALRHAHGIGWWPGRELDLISLAERLIAAGGRLRIEPVRGWRRYTGAAPDLLELNRFMLDALAAEQTPARAAGAESGADNRIEGCVRIDPTACVRSSTVVGPAIVGAGASVLESYIGPYTSIGADVLIEGVEMERSIILPGASIMHVGGRLTASVIGRDARVFRDFSLPRALRLNVGDGDEVALC